MLKEKQKQISLPDGFLFGAASSAHQVEGENSKNDWWFWEQKGKLPKSGLAVDHYNRFSEDFKLAKQIGLNAMRISIEWSRIEPLPGKYDYTEVKHYKEILLELKRLGITRMVTLHHYTLPVWLAEKDGFANRKNISAFVQFSAFIAKELGQEIDLWVTINEPEIFTSMTSIRGLWPPFSGNILRAFKLFRNLAAAHNRACTTIKKILPNAQIGIAKNNIYYEAFKSHSWLDQSAVKICTWFRNYLFLDKIKSRTDFIGLNYYFYNCLSVGLKGIKQKKLEGPISDMNWRIYPKGIYYLVKGLHERYKKPIYITENGLADSKDKFRGEFIKQHLAWLSKAISQGVNVRGYFYWSLTDTYEWHDGFKPKFGLIKINMKNLTRTARKSATVFKEIQ